VTNLLQHRRRVHSVILTAVLLLPIVPGCSPDRGEPVPLDGTPIALLDYVAVAPTAWTAKQPGSSMRLAEYDTPAVPDAEPGELVVYYFGAGQGGSVEANVERWTAQFANEDGTRPEPVITRITDAAFPTAVVELRGRYARNIGMGDASVEARPDQVLLSAILETPRGNLYVQLHGPAASVLAQKESFLSFVRSVRPHEAVS
jgi:hypothetical protein